MLSGDDKQMVSCGSDRMICVWDLRKAAKPYMINKESNSCIMACDFTNDHTHVLSATVEGEINATNIESGKMVLSHDTMALTPEVPSNIIYSLKTVRHHPKKGNIFTLGMENKLSYLIDYDPKAKFESWMLEIQQKYEGHSAGIRDAMFNPDCTRLLTCCEDHSLRLWNTETCEPICLFAGHTDFVTNGIFLNSRTVVSASWDTRVRFWNVPDEFMH